MLVCWNAIARPELHILPRNILKPWLHQTTSYKPFAKDYMHYTLDKKYDDILIKHELCCLSDCIFPTSDLTQECCGDPFKILNEIC